MVSVEMAGQARGVLHETHTDQSLSLKSRRMSTNTTRLDVLLRQALAERGIVYNKSQFAHAPHRRRIKSKRPPRAEREEPIADPQCFDCMGTGEVLDHAGRVGRCSRCQPPRKAIYEL